MGEAVTTEAADDHALARAGGAMRALQRCALRQALGWLVALGCAPVIAADYTFIVAGLGGEAEYEQRFREQAATLAEAARGAAEDASHVIALSGEAVTRKAVRGALRELAGRVAAADTVTIVLIGHGSFDGEEYRFNIPGPDLTGGELAVLFDALPAKRQLIVNTTSASGAVAETWPRDGRIVVTATKNGGERTATRFAQHWTQAAATRAADVNKDDLVTAGEAFEYARRQVEASFKADVALATEHARLEGGESQRFAVARFGAARASGGDPQVAALLTQRGALEIELNAVKDRSATLSADDYYDQLEAVLVRLALLQREIDAQQAALASGGGQ
ncbi:MAG: hypothetical protein RBS02_13605 [Steroidobacteraceae bacterium]|nr:hypothetical protein [Steroidobacteraceae bacterium]